MKWLNGVHMPVVQGLLLGVCAVLYEKTEPNIAILKKSSKQEVCMLKSGIKAAQLQARLPFSLNMSSGLGFRVLWLLNQTW